MAIVNKAEFAELVGYSPRQVSTWMESGMPCTGAGRKGVPVEINTADAIRWLIERGSMDRAEGSQRDRLALAQAQRVEFENEVRRGELIPIELHGELLRKVAGEVAGQMSGFPGRVAGKIASIKDPALVRAKLIDECNEVRDAVAGVLGDIAESFAGALPAVPDGAGDCEGPAEDDAGHLGEQQPAFAEG